MRHRHPIALQGLLFSEDFLQLFSEGWEGQADNGEKLSYCAQSGLWLEIGIADQIIEQRCKDSCGPVIPQQCVGLLVWVPKAKLHTQPASHGPADTGRVVEELHMQKGMKTGQEAGGDSMATDRYLLMITDRMLHNH